MGVRYAVLLVSEAYDVNSLAVPHADIDYWFLAPSLHIFIRSVVWNGVVYTLV